MSLLNTRKLLQEKQQNDGNIKEISVPLKYLSNFRRVLDMPLINCEVSFTLTWSKNYVLAEMTTIGAEGINQSMLQ